MRTSIDRVAPARSPSADPGRPTAHGSARHGTASTASSTFAAALAAEERAPLHWSAHANRRIERRGIALDADGVHRLARAVEVASARGARSSVVWLDRVAYVVDIPTATVLTAVVPTTRKEAVFTNIDSVVIA